MPKPKILVFDYDPQRLSLVKDTVQNNLRGYDVYDLQTGDGSEEPDLSKLQEFSKRKYAMILGHTWGQPSGKECVNAYKRYNRKGRVILYTDRDSVSLSDFDDYKLANKILQVPDKVDDKVRNSIVNAVTQVMQEPGIHYWLSPLKTTEFWSFLGAIVGLVGAIIALL